MYWVYILENPNGRFYVGYSGNLKVRLANHNRTDVANGKFTRGKGPWRLVWQEAHETRSSALRRERQIKCMKSSKWIAEKLLNGRVPASRD